MRKGISNSQNANRDRDGMLKPPPGGMGGQHAQSNNFGNAQAAGNRRANNYAAGQRPPMIPPSLNNSNLDAMNTSNISMGGGQSGSTPQNQNYRKAFKPNIPNSNLQASYEPERKSQNVMRRNLSNSNPQNVRKMDSYDNSASYGGYDPSKYEENGSNPFGGGGNGV